MTTVEIHHCPRCDLRFTTAAETEDHLIRDHDVDFANVERPGRAPSDQSRGLVIVPIDPSRHDSNAVGVARVLAAQAGYAVDLVAATPPGLDDGAVRRHLQTRARALDGLPVTTHCLGDVDPAAAVLEHAAAASTTLLCLDSHAKGPAAEAAFGSVSEAIVRAARVPVVVCGPELQPWERYLRILVGLDGSVLAERALAVAIPIAGDLGASIALLEVLPPDVTLPGDLLETAYLARVRRDAPIDIRDYETIHRRRPAKALVEAAADRPGTIVAVGTQGRSGFERLRMGSVALDVVRHARGPVLIVPPAM